MSSPGASGPVADGSKRNLSCYQCKGRKLKCDRIWPCSRCTRLGDECRFPESRQRPAYVVRRPRVKELEARLGDLEHRLENVHQTRGALQPQPPLTTPSDTQLLQAGRLEQAPPQALVDELTSIYFNKLYSEAPMQDPARYLASIHKPAHMQPPMCLQYTVLALAASLSPTRKELALAFYQRARNYIQFDEMKDDGHLVMTLGHAQCWVLLSHFEARHLWFTRASMSLSRSVRLAQMLGLQNVESPDGLMAALAPPGDWAENEERRRTMWAIFCLDRQTSSTTGWPVLLESSRIKTLLPASDESFLSGLEEPSVTLHDALRDASPSYSPLACRVLVADLYHECLDHTFKAYPQDLDSSEFGTNHQRLESRLAMMFAALPPRLRCPENLDSNIAVSINLGLHTATICLYRYFAAKAKRNRLGAGLVSGAEARLLISASEIFTIVAYVSDVDTTFSNPLVSIAAFMAAMVFLDDYSRSRNTQSEECLRSLMDLVVLMAEGNMMTASLTVQLAHELKKTGIDASAVEKVSHLASKMDPNTILMGRQDHSTGTMVFCPLEPRSGGGPSQ